MARSDMLMSLAVVLVSISTAFGSWGGDDGEGSGNRWTEPGRNSEQLPIGNQQPPPHDQENLQPTQPYAGEFVNPQPLQPYTDKFGDPYQNLSGYYVDPPEMQFPGGFLDPQQTPFAGDYGDSLAGQFADDITNQQPGQYFAGGPVPLAPSNQGYFDSTQYPNYGVEGDAINQATPSGSSQFQNPQAEGDQDPETDNLQQEAGSRRRRQRGTESRRNLQQGESSRGNMQHEAGSSRRQQRRGNLQQGASSSRQRLPSNERFVFGNPETDDMSIGDMYRNNLLPTTANSIRGCTLRTNDLPSEHALLLQPSGVKIRYPTVNDVIQLHPNAQMMAFCPGTIPDSNNSPNYLTYFYSNPMYVKCQQHTLIIQGSENTEFFADSLECRVNPEPVATGKLNSQAGESECKGLSHYQIQLPLQRFTKTMAELCVDDSDPKALNVVFVKTVLKKGVLRGQQSLGELGQYYSSAGNIYQEDVTAALFDPSTLEDTLKHQWGADVYDLMTRGPNNEQYYITQGHLAGIYYWVYRTEMKTSFFWANVKPMWSNLKRNWTRLEIAISKFAADSDTNILVYSGIFGMQGHPLRVELPLFMTLNPADLRLNRTIPAYFFKILLNADSTKCVAIVGFNSPFYDNRSNICQEIEGIEFMKSMRPGIENGLVHACGCNEFKQYLTSAQPHYFESMPLDGNVQYQLFAQ